MELRQLKYFVAVAEHENFSRAAQQLHIAQSALSRRMRELEEELGVRLFDRHLRGAALTAEGRELLDRARYLLRSVDQLRHDLSNTNDTLTGPVGVGMAPNFAAMLGAPFAKQVRVCYPQVLLRVVEAFSPDLRAQLVSGALDMALLTGNSVLPVSGLAVEPLLEDRLCLVGLASDPFLRRKEITIQQLRGLPLILTGMSSAGTRYEVEAMASRKRVQLQVTVEVSSVALALQMIRLGLGYTIHIGARAAKETDLAYVPINGLWLAHSLAWPMERPMPRAASEVLALLRLRIRELVDSGNWPGGRPLWNRKRPAR